MCVGVRGGVWGVGVWGGWGGGGGGGGGGVGPPRAPPPHKTMKSGREGCSQEGKDCSRALFTANAPRYDSWEASVHSRGKRVGMRIADT